jgi:hypothetical protein
VFHLPIPLVFLMLGPAAQAPVPPMPSGRCVEARTASVFAGACHYGAEATTGGREALIAWRFDAGSHLGVDLAGVRAAAAIASEENLAEHGAARRSILYVSDRATPAQRRAVLDLLRGAFPGVLGTVLETRAVSLDVAFSDGVGGEGMGGDDYRVACGADLALAGTVLPDRACCRMPYAVWYRPLTAMSGAVVGANLTFRSAERALGQVWDRPDENAAFVGTFEIR